MSSESNRSLLMAMCEHMQAQATNGSDDENEALVGAHFPNCDLIRKAINNNYTDFMDADDGYKQPPINTTKLVVLTIIIFFTVVGNFGVVLAILLRRGKVTRMYFFILHLSIADLLTAFCTLLPEFAWTFTFPKFYAGNAVCKIMKYLFMVGPYLSSYTLVMTAVDRYQAICFPLSNLMSTHRRSIQKSHMLAISWALSLLFSLPQVFVFHAETEEYCRAEFIKGWGRTAYVIYYSLSNFFIPFVVLLFCYTKMCAVLWGNFKQKKEQEQAQFQNTSPENRGPKNTKRKDTGDSSNNEDEDAFDKIELEVLKSPSTKSAKNVETAAEVNDESSVPIRRSSSMKTKLSLPTSSKDGRPALSKQKKHMPPKRIVSHASIEVSLTGNGNTSDHIVACPRTHSTRAISNAKIKTVKLTVVVVAGYLICSAPYVCIQLYTVLGNPSSNILASMTWLFWLMTLNSGVNPWIYMAFNPELIPFCRPQRGSRETEINSMFRRQDTALVRLRSRGAQDGAPLDKPDLNKGRRDRNAHDEDEEHEDKQSPVTQITHWNGTDQPH